MDFLGKLDDQPKIEVIMWIKKNTIRFYIKQTKFNKNLKRYFLERNIEASF